MPMQVSKVCYKCSLRIEEAGNTSFYHAACNPRPDQRANRDTVRNQSPHRHLYDSRAWRDRTRPFILSRDPICTECRRAPSMIVDHINDHKGNVQMFYSPANLHGVCKPCHDKKTGTDHGFNTPSTPAADTAPIVYSSPSGRLPSVAPSQLAVDPIHKALADGTVACKKEYARWYKKSGELWLLLDADFKPPVV